MFVSPASKEGIPVLGIGRENGVDRRAGIGMQLLHGVGNVGLSIPQLDVIAEDDDEQVDGYAGADEAPDD